MVFGPWQQEGRMFNYSNFRGAMNTDINEYEYQYN